MPTPEETRILASLAERGGVVSAKANLDPQWNAATAERKHRTDLAIELADAADLQAGHSAADGLVDDLEDRGLVELVAAPDGATLRLTEAGTDAAGQR